jgi:hypothetical protein
MNAFPLRAGCAGERHDATVPRVTTAGARLLASGPLLFPRGRPPFWAPRRRARSSWSSARATHTLGRLVLGEIHMHTRQLLFTTMLALGLSIALQAADVNGKWTAQVPGRDGQTRETTFAFKADGESVTGTMSGRQGEVPISSGKLQGDKLSFDVTLNFQGNDVVLHFRGVVSGDEIKFTRQREGADRVQEFTATRVK